MISIPTLDPTKRWTSFAETTHLHSGNAFIVPVDRLQLSGLTIINRFETSAKENTSIDASAEYLINHIVQLEMSKQSDSEYEVDYSSSDSSRLSLYDNGRITVRNSSCC